MSLSVKILKWFEALENVTFMILFFFLVHFNLALVKEGESKRRGLICHRHYKIITVFVSKLPFEAIIINHIADFQAVFHSSF